MLRMTGSTTLGHQPACTLRRQLMLCLPVKSPLPGLVGDTADGGSFLWSRC
jgi:hypothetical protein